MKNIHVLPTTQDSWLCLKDGELINANDGGCMLGYDPPRWLTQHIYITSDEDIKEGDWFMSDFNSFPIHNIKELSEREGTLGWKQEDLKNNLKIILTTDQDLIKDGVQAIDDEFLEWFVKHPNCEFVEVIDKMRILNFDELRERHRKGLPHLYSEKICSKIIIPKEEPKQEDCSCTDKCLGYLTKTCERIEEPKQETLEEAAEKYSLELLEAKTIQHHEKTWIKSMFIHSAKWQQEQICTSEFIQHIRATKSDAEARRLIIETFKG